MILGDRYILMNFNWTFTYWIINYFSIKVCCDDDGGGGWDELIWDELILSIFVRGLSISYSSSCDVDDVSVVTSSQFLI